MRAFLVITIFALAFGCKSQKAATDENSLSKKTPTSEPDTVVMVVEKPVEPKDSLVIAFEKTPCFGRCPTYKIRVYDSGFATYEGLNFAEKMGLYATRFTPEQIKNIYQSAVDIGYFDLQSEYNNPNVTDLPSTISRIHYDGKDQRIRARMGIPEKLKAFHENLSVKLLEQDWEPYSDR